MNLTDFFAPALLSAFYTFLLGLSFAIVFDEAGQKIFKRRESLARAMYFFAGLLTVSWLTLLVCMAGWVSVLALRIFAIGIVAIAAGVTVRKRGKVLFAGLSGLPRSGWFFLLGISILLILIALAPPTDADSLDYHLGVPVQILREHGLDFDKNQLHFRMFGFGEMLNLIGVANGCVSFGAFVQLISVFWLLAVYRESLPDTPLPVILMLVFGIPVLIALMPACKHLLTGVCCTTACFIYVFRNKRTGVAVPPILFLLCLLFAVGIKYSFIVSVSLLALYWLVRGGTLRVQSALGAIGLAIIVYGPLFLFKVLHFNDPFSPFAEQFFNHDPVVLWLSTFIRSYTESGFSFPLSVIVPSSPGAIAAVIGWGAFILISCYAFFRTYPVEIIIVSILYAFIIFFGQKTARFFIEPYLWMLPLWITQSKKRIWGPFFLLAAKAQFILFLPFIGYLSWSLGRGITSNARREAVLCQNASFYETAQWINAIIPRDAVVLTNVRSRALLTARAFPIEYYYAFPGNEKITMLVDSMIRKVYHVQYFALINPQPKFIEKYCGALIAGPKTFLSAARNP